MSIYKNIALVPVVHTVSAKVFGPTDYSDSVVASLNGKSVYRSDYLDKLEDAIGKKDAKYVKTFALLPDAKIKSARGYDADHPFVLVEKGVARAWRYIAIVG